MDVSRYNFLCQKALHQGLQYARSYAHLELEVEHIAFGLIRSEAVDLEGDLAEDLSKKLQKYLNQLVKDFSSKEVQFGMRLDRALDRAEEEAGQKEVDETLLWDCLLRQSTLLKQFFQLSEIQSNKEAVSLEDKESSEALREKKSPLKADKKLSQKLTKVLEQFTEDLTAKASQSQLDPVIGRDLEVRRVLEILGRKKKNNPVLIGEAGVGKTAVAEFLAQRIVAGEAPGITENTRVLSLDLAGLLAGAKFRGEFEQRMKDLLEALQICGTDVIVFIDELHMLVGAGGQEGTADAANLMKPALARGELQCLGATTLDEYRQYIEKDAALERRFQPVLVEEPSRQIALSILRGLKRRYEMHHGVQILDSALIAAVDLSMRYLASRRLPDKAIDIMDEACSRLRLKMATMPRELEIDYFEIQRLEIEKKLLKQDSSAQESLAQVEVKLLQVEERSKEQQKLWDDYKTLLKRFNKHDKRLQELVIMYEQAKNKGDFQFASRMEHDERPKLEEKIAKISEDLNNLQTTTPWLQQFVDGNSVAQVIAEWTGIPVQRALRDEAEQLLSLEERLKTRVFGQKEALNMLSRAVRRARVGIQEPDRPLGSFIFLGPTGVGKTETAKTVAEEVFGDKNQMISIDMSEYMEQHSVSRLIGSPPGYVGYGQGGQLSEAVRQRPYGVVLLDEIEKAHTRVLDVLLQILDEGRLTDGSGRNISFRNCIIILTSNIPIWKEVKDGNDEVKRKALAKKMRPEIVGRIDELVLFQALGQEQFGKLLDKVLLQLNERLENRKLRIVLGSHLRDKILESCLGSEFGGRVLKRTFQTLVVDQVSERLLTYPSFMTGAWRLEINLRGAFLWQVDDSLDTYLLAAS